MSYRRRPLGEEPRVESGPLAIVRGRGYVAIPSADVREYVQQSLLVGVIGFGFGLTVGAMLKKGA